MKTKLSLFSFLLFGIIASRAQSYEFGLNYNPHKFYLSNPVDKVEGSGYAEALPNLLSGNSFGVFFNKNLTQQQAIQFDLNFLHQKQYYIYTGLISNKSEIYTAFSSINLNISHNLYLWDYEDSEDNIYFGYGLALNNMINYTDYYNLETETKVNGVSQKEIKTVIVENDAYVSTTLVTRNDSMISLTGDARKGAARYNNLNIGANASLNFLHYFTDNLAFSAGIKGSYYFMNPENRGSNLWNQASAYKYGDVTNSDKRGPSKIYSFGLNLSLIFAIGRF